MKIKFALAALALAGITSVARAQNSPVSVSGASNLEFNTAVATDTISIALKLDGVKFSDLKFSEPRPFTIRNGNRSDQRFFRGVSFSAADGPPHILLTVQTDLLDDQGAYDVNLEYTISTTGKTGYLNFTLTRAAAVLTVPAVTITETGNDLVSDPLTLKETGGKAGIRIVAARLAPPVVPGINSTSLITFPDTAVSITPGGQQPIRLIINPKALGKLQLGKTTATMLITQKGLAAPVQVEFNIWNKRSKWWIIAVVIAGLTVGYFVKHFLKDKRNYDQARLNAMDLIRDINAFSISVHDPGFQSGVTQITGNLQAALDQQNATDLNAAATALNAATDAAKTAYNTLKTTLQTNITNGITAFNTLAGQLYDTAYEKPVQARLADAEATLQQAKHQLDVSNPTQATILMGQATTQATTDVLAYVNYSNTLLTFFTARANYFPNAPASDTTWTNITQQTSAIQNSTTAVSTATAPIQTLLGQINGIQVLWRGLVTFIARQVLQDFQNASATGAADIGFKTAFNTWISALGAMVNNQQLVDTASFYWNTIFLADVNNSWTKAVPATQTTGVDAPAAAVIPVYNLAAGLFAQTQTTAPVFQFNILQPGELSRSYKVVLKEYWLYTVLQSVLLALLICVGSLMTYGKNFIGTTDEIIGLFFFAFSLDLTVDSLAQFSKKPPTS